MNTGLWNMGSGLGPLDRPGMTVGIHSSELDHWCGGFEVRTGLVAAAVANFKSKVILMVGI